MTDSIVTVSNFITLTLPQKKKYRNPCIQVTIFSFSSLIWSSIIFTLLSFSFNAVSFSRTCVHRSSASFFNVRKSQFEIKPKKNFFLKGFTTVFEEKKIFFKNNFFFLKNSSKSFEKKKTLWSTFAFFCFAVFFFFFFADKNFGRVMLGGRSKNLIRLVYLLVPNKVKKILKEKKLFYFQFRCTLSFSTH